MGWIIALVILLALFFLPFGFCAVYRQSNAGVWLLIGPLKFRVFPGNKKENNTKQQDNDKAENEPTKGGNLRDFWLTARTLFQFLEEFRKKIRVKNLEVKLVLAGDDPSDLAVNYGRAWAAVGNLIPHLERFFVIKKRNIQVECDFLADQTRVYARLDATITLIRALQLLSKHGIKVIKQLMNLKKLRKGGAEL